MGLAPSTASIQFWVPGTLLPASSSCLCLLRAKWERQGQGKGKGGKGGPRPDANQPDLTASSATGIPSSPAPTSTAQNPASPLPGNGPSQNGKASAGSGKGGSQPCKALVRGDAAVAKAALQLLPRGMKMSATSAGKKAKISTMTGRSAETSGHRPARLRPRSVGEFWEPPRANPVSL